MIGAHIKYFLHRADWQTGRVLGDLSLFLFHLQMMLDTLVEILVLQRIIKMIKYIDIKKTDLLPGLNHVDPGKLPS